MGGGGKCGGGVEKCIVVWGKMKRDVGKCVGRGEEWWGVWKNEGEVWVSMLGCWESEKRCGEVCLGCGRRWE